MHVRQRVTEISVKGQDRISVGKKAAFKTTVRPSNAYNKKVTWSLDVPEGVTASVSRDGKVTVTAAQDGDTLILRATAADGSGVTGEKEIVVSSQVRAIRFDRTKKTLFTADLPGTEEDERVFQLVPEITGNSSVPMVYTSSDRTVATVDGSGLVTALKKGKAVITCKASDGSGAAAKMEFTVRVPASSLSISNPYSHTLGTGDYISAGCSIRHSFKLGSAYGAPSIQKIRWSAAVSYYDGTQYVTDTSGKYAKVGSTGTLQALSAITGLLDWYSDVKVELTGQTTDGTGLSDTLSYTVIRKPKGLIAETGSVTVYTDGETSVDVVVRTNPDYSGYSTIDSFTVRSADPKIAGAIVRTSTAMTIAGRSYYTVKIRIYGGQRTGKTTITVTSNDGSNCKCTIAVKTVE